MNKKISVPAEMQMNTSSSFNPKFNPSLIGAISPMNRDFFLPIDAGFSWQYHKKSKGEILFKDGIATILWFLLNQKKSSLPLSFYCHSSLARFIPDEFRSLISFYELKSKNKKVNRFQLVTGFYLAGFSSAKFWKASLDKMKHKEISLILHYERNGISTTSNDSEWWDLYDQSLAHIKKNHLDYFDHIAPVKRIEGCQYTNLNERLLIALDYLEWKSFMLGAIPQKSPKKLKVFKSFSLSEHCDLEIGEIDMKCVLSAEELRLLREFCIPELLFPPTSFIHFVKFLIEKYQR
jgi:hypothetical protein